MKSGRLRTKSRPLLVAASVVLLLAIAVVPAIVVQATDVTIFSDGFESGNLASWTESSGMVGQSQIVFSGSWAGRATVAKAKGYASKTLSMPQSEVTFNAKVNLQSSSGTVALLRFRTASGSGIASLKVNKQGKLFLRNEASSSSAQSGTVLTKGVWHTVRTRILVAGPSSVAEVWLDGIRLDDISGTQPLGASQIGRLQIGTNTSVTMDVVFDDVEAISPSGTSTTPPPADAPPTTPQNLQTTGVSSSLVQLAWTASSDDQGVTGYGIYRDGSLIGTAPGTSYSDGTVAPGTTYFYSVDAVDTASNRSPRSPAISVTTPDADTEPPTTPTGLTAQASTSGSVDLQWSPSTDNVAVTSYTVYRDGAQLATTDASTTTYTDATVASGTTYTYEVSAGDATGNTSARSQPAQATTPQDDPVVTAAGDICPSTPTNCTGTANLVLSLDPDVALTLGDNQYPDGALSQYMSSYDLQWGKFKSRTRPAPGNHEWHIANAQGYRDYFGTTILTNGGAWYSFNLGAWHLISLDSMCSLNGGCAPGSAQYNWLQQDLAADNHGCTLAYWHHPRFSSGTNHGGTTSVQPFWDLLQAEGAELVLNGHEHNYERFAPQTPSGAASTSGIRQFVAGTGGQCCYPFGTPKPNSEVRITGSRGVLELTLAGEGYAWRFIDVSGAVLDSGTGACH